MPSPHAIALVGFSAFERQALGSYLRLMADRRPAYQPVQRLEDAALLVVDADHAGFADQVRRAGRQAEAVFVGSQAPTDGSAWLQRPIDPQHLLRELDVLAALVASGATAPPPLAVPPLAEAAVLPPEALPGLPALRDLAPLPPGPAPEPAPPPAPPLVLRTPAPVRTAPGVLLVDDSDIALRYLEKFVAEQGLTPYCARTSQEALALLAREHFCAVVLDLDLGDTSPLDGLALCQKIKREHLHLGDAAPPVALVTAHQGPLHRVRADLAGADAFLTKPLQQEDLRALFRPLLAALGAQA